MVLDTIYKSIKAITSSSQISYHIEYDDEQSTQKNNSKSGSIEPELTTLLSEPEENKTNEQAYLKRATFLSSNNNSGINQTVTFYIYDSSGPTTTILFRCVLLPNYTVTWDVNSGWQLFDDKGYGIIPSSDSIPPKIIVQSDIAVGLADLYIVPTGYRAEIDSVIVSNSYSSDVAFSMAIGVNGEADATKQYMFSEYPIERNDTLLVERVLKLSQSDIIRVNADHTGLAITLLGKLIPLVGSDES